MTTQTQPTPYIVELTSGFTEDLLVGQLPTLISSKQIESYSVMGAAVHVLKKHLEAPEVWVRQEIAGTSTGITGLYSLCFGPVTYIVHVSECVIMGVLV